MKIIATPLMLVALSACMPQGPVGQEIDLRFKAGEALMNDCELRQQRCDDYLAFIERWNRDHAYTLSFPKSLEAYKKKVAAGTVFAS